MTILASQADVQARLGRNLTADEISRLPGLLEEASLLVEGYLGVVYETDDVIPDAVRVVVSRIVARAFSSPSPQLLPEGARSAGSGPYNIGFGSDGRTNLWLSKADKMTLGNLGGGMNSIPLKSERC